MDENKNLVNLTNEILTKLTEAHDVLNALDEIVDGDRAIEPLLKFVRSNISTALDRMDECKTLIFD